MTSEPTTPDVPNDGSLSTTDSGSPAPARGVGSEGSLELGEILVRETRLTPEQLERARLRQIESNERLADVLVEIRRPDGELVAGGRLESSPEPLTVSLGGCAFEPQLLVLPLGSRVELRNADGILHELTGLSLRNELWGKARDYFDSSLKLQVTADACAELARLLARLGEHQASTEYYQQGLLLTTNPLPDLPLP